MNLNPACPKCAKPMAKTGAAHSGKQRWRCNASRAQGRTYCYSTTMPDGTVRNQRGDTVNKKSTPLRFKRSLNGAKRMLVTCAQNATPVHAGFWASLEAAANVMDAELVVIPTRYKNPTSRFSASQQNADVWADETLRYLCNERKRVNANLSIMGDIKTQPTAVSPLTGFEGITHGESGIFGHTKLQFRSVPTPQAGWPKILTTTGACTIANYTDSRTGKAGEFHHTLGACLVEMDGKRFHLRQINADSKTGEFTDLDKVYSPAGVRKAPRALALIPGDIHADFIDPQVERALFGKDGMADLLNPEWLVWHDANDGYSVNPHHFGNSLIALAKGRADRSNPREEMERTFQFMQDRTKGRKSVLVPSNHNDFLMRWLLATNPHTQPQNMEFWCETMLGVMSTLKFGGRGTDHSDALTYWARKALSADKFKVLARDESFSLAGIELGMHGDAGPNGSRGNIKNLRRLGTRSVIGHSHTPGIEEGCYQTGTSTGLKLEYCKGPSSWLQSSVALYASGKRSIITVIDGKWRT